MNSIRSFQVAAALLRRGESQPLPSPPTTEPRRGAARSNSSGGAFPPPSPPTITAVPIGVNSRRRPESAGFPAISRSGRHGGFPWQSPLGVVGGIIGTPGITQVDFTVLLTPVTFAPRALASLVQHNCQRGQRTVRQHLSTQTRYGQPSPEPSSTSLSLAPVPAPPLLGGEVTPLPPPHSSLFFLFLQTAITSPIKPSPRRVF